jgi:YbbR domain-containing protein
VRRATGFLLRNWPLKLGAVLLATVLYSGLVLSQNVRTWTGAVPIDTTSRPHPTAVLRNAAGDVTVIRYRAPLDVGVLLPDSFRASVDLTRVRPREDGSPTAVPVSVVALDNRVQIVDFQPQSILVTLEPVAEKTVPVDVEESVPLGIEAGTPRYQPSQVTVRGAASLVSTVQEAVARVSIDASGLIVDRPVDLVAVDNQGDEVLGVELEPSQARVQISVARVLETRSLPVAVPTVGEPAFGHRIADISVEPQLVTVSGEESTVVALQAASTERLDLTGRDSNFQATLPLSLPEGVAVSGDDEVRVTIRIAVKEGSLDVPVAVEPLGARSDRTYSLGAGQVNVSLAGPVPELEQLDTTQLRAFAEVSGLDVGTHVVAVEFTAPVGLELQSVEPREVTVVVSAPLETPGASPATTGTILRIAL